MQDVKVCPVCESEYYPDVLVCADCQVALVWPPSRVELAPLQDDGGWGQFAPGEILGQLAGDTEKIIRIYRANILNAGIDSAMVPLTFFAGAASGTLGAKGADGHILDPSAGQAPVGDLAKGFQFLLFVRQADFSAADKIIKDIFTDLHPDMEGVLYQEFEAGQCPACGAGVPEDAEECPDCGLPLA